MSFLNTIGSWFSPDLSGALNQGLTQGYNLASNALGQGIGAINQGYGQGIGALQQGFGTARTDLSNYFNTAEGQLSSAFSQALPFLQQQYGNAINTMGGLLSTGQAGTQRLEDLLGFGAGGSAGQQAALEQTPGYQFTRNQGIQAGSRAAAAGGYGGSGNAMAALANYGSGLANTTYQSAVQNLNPFLQMYQQGTQGLSNLYTGLGQNVAGLQTQLGTGLANLSTGLGSGLANLSTGLGSGLAGLYTGQGNALAGQYGNLASLGWGYGTGTGAANAQQNVANTNYGMGILGGLGNLLTGQNFFGGGGRSSSGGGGLFNLGSLFGGGTGGSGGMFNLSDERLKKDIEKVGELHDGLGVFKYSYLWDDTPRLGLMAQEVEKRNPEAVREFGGWKAVDYGAATARSAQMARFLEMAA